MGVAAKENAFSAANFNPKAKGLHLFILNHVGHSVNWNRQSSTLVRVRSVVSELMVRQFKISSPPETGPVSFALKKTFPVPSANRSTGETLSMLFGHSIKPR